MSCFKCLPPPEKLRVIDPQDRSYARFDTKTMVATARNGRAARKASVICRASHSAVECHIFDFNSITDSAA
jgi:hypothetical protein